MWVRDRLDGLWCDEDFAGWYPRDGCPDISPAVGHRLCAAVPARSVGLSGSGSGTLPDRFQVRPGHGAGWSRLPSQCAGRLPRAQATAPIDLALACLKEAGLVRERTMPRTDSTHVLAAVRDLTRLKLVTEAIRAGLEVVARTASHLLTGLVDEDWERRYGRPACLGKNYTRPKTRILTMRRRRLPTAGTPPPARTGFPARPTGRGPAADRRLPLRHDGALCPSRAHHQLEGVRRACHRDMCLRQRQRDHGRGHHLGRHERRPGPSPEVDSPTHLLLPGGLAGAHPLRR